MECFDFPYRFIGNCLTLRRIERGMLKKCVSDVKSVFNEMCREHLNIGRMLIPSESFVFGVEQMAKYVKFSELAYSYM